MGFSLKSDRRSSRELDRAVADLNLDTEKKEGSIFAAGAAWLANKKGSSSSLALDIQQRKESADKKSESSLSSPQIPLSFDSLHSLTQELGSYMVSQEGLQDGPAPVRVALVSSELPSVITVASTATIQPATATIVSSSTTAASITPSFLPPLRASPPLDFAAEPSIGAVATGVHHTTSPEFGHNNNNINTNTANVSSPALSDHNSNPAAQTSSPSSFSSTSLSGSPSQQAAVGKRNSDNNSTAATTPPTMTLGALASDNSHLPSSLHSPTHNHAQAQQQTPPPTQLDENSNSSASHPDLQRYQLQDVVLSPTSLSQQTNTVLPTSSSLHASSSSTSSSSSSLVDPSLPSTGTLSPSTQTSSPTMLAHHQQQQLKSPPPLAPRPMMPNDDPPFVTYYVTPQAPLPVNGPQPVLLQQQQQQAQQNLYQPPPPMGFQHQSYHPPPPPPSSIPQQQQYQQQYSYQPPPSMSPTAAMPAPGIPSPTSEMQTPRRSVSSTQMHQQYVQQPASQERPLPPLPIQVAPLPVVPVPTEDWGALLDRPDSPTQMTPPPHPYSAQYAPPAPFFTSNGMTASPAEETTISRDYMTHQRQPSRSTPSPQPPNPYQAGMPLYGSVPPPQGLQQQQQRNHHPYMTHQQHASMSSVPANSLAVGGNVSAPQQQNGVLGDNRQAFRRSWSSGTALNGADRQSMLLPVSGPSGPRTPPNGAAHSFGYNTPPRAGSGSHSKQGSVATSVSLLTDAAVVAKYRETAIKTNDTSIQMSYAKYLLEIGSDPKLNQENLQQTSSSSSSPVPDAGNNGNEQWPTPPKSSSSSTNSSDGATSPGRKLSSEDQELAGKRQLLQEAVYWIDRLAKEGQPEAQFIRGTWYEEGLYGTKRSPDKALRWFQSSSKGDYAPAHYKVGYYCEKKKDFNKAVILYKKAAVQNDVPANHRLAMVYLYGELNQDQNMKTGLQYLNRAATNATESAPMSPYILGLILSREYKQLSIPDDIAFPDDGEALEWFKKAAELGYGPANYKLGYCYEYGALRCPIDPFLSVKYYERAVMAGDSNGEAEMALSGWYLSGADNFFAADDSLAFQYAQRAADKGLAKAQYAMGYYYEVGISVAADMNKAMEFYKLSAAQGNKDAQKRLSDRSTFDKLGHKNSVRRIKQGRNDKDKECIIM